MYPDQKLRRRKKSGEERRRHFPSDTRQENRGKICPAAPSPPAHSLALAHSPQPDIVGPAALQFWAAVAGARRCREFRTKGVLLYFVQLASSGIGRPRIRWCGLGYASDDWLRTAGSWAAVDGRDWQGLAGGETAVAQGGEAADTTAVGWDTKTLCWRQRGFAPGQAEEQRNEETLVREEQERDL